MFPDKVQTAIQMTTGLVAAVGFWVTLRACLRNEQVRWLIFPAVVLLAHTVVFYAVVILAWALKLDTHGVLNDWSSVLRFHSTITVISCVVGFVRWTYPKYPH